MPGSPTKRARLATDRAAASGADLPQEGPFFGRARKTKCADAADCAFGQGGWQGSPGPFDAVHGTQVTVTLTGASADAMEVEAVGDIADQRGDDAEAGARMDCDDVGDEGGVPWDSVTEMPDAVRTVESVQGPEWVTVPWQAGSLLFLRQPTGSSQHVVDTGAQDCLYRRPETASADGGCDMTPESAHKETRLSVNYGESAVRAASSDRTRTVSFNRGGVPVQTIRFDSHQPAGDDSAGSHDVPHIQKHATVIHDGSNERQPGFDTVTTARESAVIRSPKRRKQHPGKAKYDLKRQADKIASTTTLSTSTLFPP